MIDKPIPAKIFLNLSEKNTTGEDFIGLSNTLYTQNLIYSEPRELRRSKNILELTIIFRDNYSFENWTNNKQILELWSFKFNTLLVSKPKTTEEENVIIDIDNIRNCICKKSEFYILQGRSLQFMDELTCNECLGQISYAKVPLEIKLEDWQKKHERIYLNWLENGLFEKEALVELTNYKKGKLNLSGEQIRKKLSDFFKLPVYINYFSEEPYTNHNCPICGDEGLDSGVKKVKRVCKKCNTIFGDEI